MLTYLSNVELSAALIDSNPDKTLYFQDVALFPAFLHLTAAQANEIPTGIAVTPLFEATKRAIRYVLPGAAWNAQSFLPISLQFSPVDISRFLFGFGSNSTRIVMGISYTLFDDISSDLFVIMPSDTPLATLNSIYTGSHRITPTNVIATLKRIGELLTTITNSNTAEIPNPSNPTIEIELEPLIQGKKK